ncbi:MAG: hypothetical protein AAGI27_03195 [Pseudomonadota bacterium]
MDPYTTPNSKTAKPVAGAWSRRTTAALIGLFVLVNLLSAAQVVQVYYRFGAEWLGGEDTFLFFYASAFVLRAVVAALYFFGFRWFYWLIVASMLAIYVIPSQFLPTGLMNGPASVTLVLAIGLGLARSNQQYLMPWRSTGGT